MATGDAAVDAIASDASDDRAHADFDAGPSGDGAIDASTDDSGVVLGAPITAPPNTWTWIDFPTSMCDDGTPTGIGINPSATSTNVLLFFEGGGACWDYQTCVQLNTSTHGPFGAAQFQAISANTAGTIVDRNAAASPFKDWSFVFVPYCTGDEHGGSADMVYTSGGSSKTIHHRGHDNVVAFLSRLGATFTAPGKLAVSGSSAGGGGTLFNYATIRGVWPNAKSYLVDDSLPLFEGDSIAPALRNAWFASWNLGKVVDPICGTACRANMSLMMKSVAARYPNDRMALLSSVQDQTIRTYYNLTPTQFQTALVSLANDVLEPSGIFKHFYVTGSTHTMLGSPASFLAAGMDLWMWLTKMVTNDVSWASVP